jgi:hypothetical protein
MVSSQLVILPRANCQKLQASRPDSSLLKLAQIPLALKTAADGDFESSYVPSVRLLASETTANRLFSEKSPGALQDVHALGVGQAACRGPSIAALSQAFLYANKM